LDVDGAPGRVAGASGIVRFNRRSAAERRIPRRREPVTAFKKTVHLEGGKAVVLQALTRRDASGMAWLDLMLTRIEEGRSADAGAAFIPLGASEVLPVAGDVNAAMLVQRQF